MKEKDLKVEIRTELRKNKVKKLREAKIIPGVIYGPDVESLPIQINRSELVKLFSENKKRNMIINLHFEKDGKQVEQKVISQEFSLNPISQKVEHIDFLLINDKNPIKAEVPLHIVGIPVGVKKGGMLIHSSEEIYIKCLPSALPEYVEINVASLDLGSIIKVKNLPKSKDYEIVSDPHQVIVKVQIPKGSSASGSGEETEGASVGEGEVSGNNKKQGE